MGVKGAVCKKWGQSTKSYELLVPCFGISLKKRTVRGGLYMVVVDKSLLPRPPPPLIASVMMCTYAAAQVIEQNKVFFLP